MHINVLSTVVLLGGALLLGRCSTSPTEQSGPKAVVERDGKVFIIDVTGKSWEVTHAKEMYGMEPHLFQYGLGLYAIRPILDPEMLSRGERGYPADNEIFLVLGTEIDNDARAYPLEVMSYFEIVDEKFGNTHVAVAY